MKLETLICNDKFIYLIGFIWADGHLNKSITSLSFSTTEKDMEYLLPLAIEIFPHGKLYKIKKRKESWQQCYSFNINDTILCKELFNLDYREKSSITPSKILNIIPNNKHYLFWMGYFDGDGTLRVKKNINSCSVEISICSTYEQDWNSLANLSKNLNIPKFRIKKEISKLGHKCSKFIFEDLISSITFLKYIYKSEYSLPRKRETFKDILNYIEDYLLKNLTCHKWINGKNIVIVDIDKRRYSVARCSSYFDGFKAKIRFCKLHNSKLYKLFKLHPIRKQIILSYFKTLPCNHNCH
ncbi:MAG: hypothetical protein EKK57_02770 [Proteobacteria bacterium]|nr:MAG: hypothetical protein EKK57_02770 [Pseudomonadota bacterium]